MSKNVLQRIIAAIFPKKRRAARTSLLTCTVCAAPFEGRKGTLTCSKACKKERSKKAKPETPPLPLDGFIVGMDKPPDIK
jgi:hypothetical protein